MSLIILKDIHKRSIALGTGFISKARGEQPFYEFKQGKMPCSTINACVCASWQRTQNSGEYAHDFVYIYEWANQPLGDMLKKVQFGDKVFFIGELEQTPYTTQNGEQKMNRKVHLEWLQVLPIGAPDFFETLWQKRLGDDQTQGADLTSLDRPYDF